MAGVSIAARAIADTHIDVGWFFGEKLFELHWLVGWLTGWLQYAD